MTDPGTTPDPAEADDDSPSEAAAEAPAGTADGARPAAARPVRRRRRWLRWASLSAAVLVLGAAGTGWALYQKLNGNIRTDTETARELAKHEDERPVALKSEAQNILLLGSDSRAGANSAYGRTGGARSDTTILLHLSADRSSATAVSLPRDLMVDIPGCSTEEGESTRAQFAQFNWAYQFGGAACTIRTVENLTGVRIDHHMIVDFSGFKKLVDAVGGVEVCLPHDVHDPDAQLDLPAGRQTLDGEDALGYVRARKGFDGSDTQRISRQQEFLGSLVKKVQDRGTLLNPAKLYPFLDAATSALTADPGLDSLGELYDLVRGLRDIPEDGVRFLTVPRRPYALDPNRDELVQPGADRLFDALREDRPVRVTDGTQPGTRHDTGTGTEPDGKAGAASGSESGDGAGGTTPHGTIGSPASTPGSTRSSPDDSPSGASSPGPSPGPAASPAPPPSASPSTSSSRSPESSTSSDSPGGRSPASVPTYRGSTAGSGVCSPEGGG